MLSQSKGDQYYIKIYYCRLKIGIIMARVGEKVSDKPHVKKDGEMPSDPIRTRSLTTKGNRRWFFF